MTEILDKYDNPDNLKNMDIKELQIFAGDIRKFLIDSVSKTGGHLASNLGVVELTLVLHKIFDFKTDKIIWDVGHQAYVHKILTGRKEAFKYLRKYGGISGFPKLEESEFDAFGTGHSSTSISAALGIARARDLDNKNFEVVSVIGDGALTGGMAYEALNDLGYSKTKIVIILNDNQMSISKNVGGMSKYLNKIRIDPTYNKVKKEVKNRLNKTNLGAEFANSIQKLKDGVKQIFVPGMFFEDMGIKYLGPIDGHNIKELIEVLTLAKEVEGPVLIHVITQKGKGYNFAEKNPNKFHSIGPFNCESGEVCKCGEMTYSKAFGSEITELAAENKKIVAITAAMPDGTGLSAFASKFPNRFFDVGIAEQHAVTMAAGFATQGYKPIFAVYSTFLQRAYDQIIHDVCLQNLPVILAVDRAGITGEDGATHHGVFDLSYLTHMPNMTIMSPKCSEELKYMLRWAVKQNQPIAIRYPRGADNCNVKLSPEKKFTKGKWELLIDEGELAIIATGKMVQTAVIVREKLLAIGIKATIISACFVKPIDEVLINNLVKNNYKIVTIEDNVLVGGFGAYVLEYINTLSVKSNILTLGYTDKFITHGNVDLLYKLNNLDVDGILESILKFI